MIDRSDVLNSIICQQCLLPTVVSLLFGLKQCKHAAHIFGPGMQQGNECLNFDEKIIWAFERKASLSRIFVKLIYGRFWVFVLCDQGKHAASIGTMCCFFTGYLENIKYPPDKNCIADSRHKII